jgi:hypothetical protein
VTRARGGNYAGMIGQWLKINKRPIINIPLKIDLISYIKLESYIKILKTVIEDIVARTAAKGFLVSG